MVFITGRSFGIRKAGGQVSQGQLPPEPLDPDVVEAGPMEITTGSF